MDDVFTRRGFVRTAGLGFAALWLPSLAQADQVMILTPRWELAAGELSVTLFLRVSSGQAMELPANALRVFTRAETGPEFELQSEGIASQRRSRAGFRLTRRVRVPEGEELAYDTYTGEWPPHLSGRVSMTLRTQLQPLSDTLPEADRPGLAALASLTGQLSANVQR